MAPQPRQPPDDDRSSHPNPENLPVLQLPKTVPATVALCVGAGLGLAVGFWVSVNSSANHPKAPEGLAFWVVVMVVIAVGLTGLVGGLLAKTGNSKKPPPLETLLRKVALHARLDTLTMVPRSTS